MIAFLGPEIGPFIDDRLRSGTQLLAHAGQSRRQPRNERRLARSGSETPLTGTAVEMMK